MLLTRLQDKLYIGGKEGLSIARQLGFLTYRSSKSYDQRFTPDEVVSYQQHQGDKFKEYFDLNCYLTLLDVLDSHHLDRGEMMLMKSFNRWKRKY